MNRTRDNQNPFTMAREHGAIASFSSPARTAVISEISSLKTLLDRPSKTRAEIESIFSRVKQAMEKGLDLKSAAGQRAVGLYNRAASDFANNNISETLDHLSTLFHELMAVKPKPGADAAQAPAPRRAAALTKIADRIRGLLDSLRRR